MKGTVLFDPKLGELMRELREAVKTGKMRWEDAHDTLKKAIRKSLDEHAQVVDLDAPSN